MNFINSKNKIESIEITVHQIKVSTIQQICSRTQLYLMKGTQLHNKRYFYNWPFKKLLKNTRYIITNNNGYIYSRN